MSHIKFCTHGIRIDGTLHSGWYSLEKSKTITFFCRSYKRLPRIEGVQIENRSDVQSDYFDEDHFSIPAGHPLYASILSGYEKQQAWNAGRDERREKRRERMTRPPEMRKKILVVFSNRRNQHVLSTDGIYPAIYTPKLAERVILSIPPEFSPTIAGRGYLRIAIGALPITI